MRNLIIWSLGIGLLGLGFIPSLSQQSLAYENSLLGVTSSYEKALRKYTQEKAHYSITDLSVVYKWFVTYHSQEFLRAMDQRFQKYYPEGGTPFAEKLKGKADSPGQSQFFVALYASDPSLRTSEGAKNFWEAHVVAGGQVFKPSLVEEIPLNAFYYRFYSYLTPKWFKAFRVIFPFDPQKMGVEDFELNLNSVAGTEKIKFKIN